MGHILHSKYHFMASKFCSSEFIFGIPFKNRFTYNFFHLNWMWFQLKPFKSHIIYLCTATSRECIWRLRRIHLTVHSCDMHCHSHALWNHPTYMSFTSAVSISYFWYGWVHNSNMFPNCLPVAVQGKRHIAISIQVKQCSSVQYGHGPEFKILFVDILSFLLVFYSI